MCELFFFVLLTLSCWSSFFLFISWLRFFLFSKWLFPWVLGVISFLFVVPLLPLRHPFSSSSESAFKADCTQQAIALVQPELHCPCAPCAIIFHVYCFFSFCISSSSEYVFETPFDKACSGDFYCAQHAVHDRRSAWDGASSQFQYAARLVTVPDHPDATYATTSACLFRHCAPCAIAL